MLRHTAAVAASLACVTALTACSGSSGDGHTVVATTGPLGSIASQITDCAGGTTETLIGPGDDPHEFSLSSEQLTDLVRSELVVTNGLGLEAGMQDGLRNAESEGATVYEVAPELDPIPFAEPGHAGHEHAGHDHEGQESHEGHDHGDEDPHVWLDAGRMSTAATDIGTELARVTGRQKYVTCGRQVATDLDRTDRQVRQILSRVPPDRRVLVTDHEAFGYFADAYDFRVVGAVIPGGSTEAEASSQGVAGLSRTIAETGVPAIFSNASVRSSVVDNVAREGGGDLKVVQLHVESLGPAGSGADTYQTMMLTDARRIASALGG